MADFTIKQNDTSPTISVVLNGANGSPIDLSGATVVFKMGKSSGTLKVNETITVASPSSGRVTYDWSEGDTDTSGTYFAEFEVTYYNGKKETFPNTRPFTVAIKADKL